MKSVIDNIATQAIEWCLIAYVGDLLSPSHVLQMDEKFVRQIAAESRQTQTLRERTHQKLAALQSGLEICQVHVTRKPSSASSLIASTLSFDVVELNIVSVRGRTLHSPLASLRATASDLGLGREDRRGRPSMESVSEVRRDCFLNPRGWLKNTSLSSNGERNRGMCMKAYPNQS